MGMLDWLFGSGSQKRRRVLPDKIDVPASAGANTQSAAAIPDAMQFLKKATVSEQCIASLNRDNHGIVLVKESLVQEFMKSNPHFSAERAARSAAAMLGLLACRGGMSPEAATRKSAEMVERGATVKRLDSASEVLDDAPSGWRVPVYQVYF